MLFDLGKAGLKWGSPREFLDRLDRVNGFSNSKTKRLKDELTFNNLLNIVLPLSLTKAKLRKMQAPIEAVDRLRGIRNGLVHGNITEKDVDPTAIENGIEQAIRLVRFLRNRLA